MRFKKYLHVTPSFYSIGNAAEEILWAYKRSKIDDLQLNVIAPYSWTEFLSYRICNRELFCLIFDFYKKHNILSSAYLALVRLVVNIVFVFKRGVSILSRKYINLALSEAWNFPEVGKKKYWPVYDDFSKRITLIKNDKIVAKIHERFEVKLRNKTKIICAQRLAAFGLPENAKYVCLHVRDAGFHGDNARRSYRNADIDTYKKGIDYLVSKGLYVIRMGDSKMKKINFTCEKLIDYPFTSIKSEEMDLFLISNCEFYVGMQSGIYDVALLFDKPVLLLNMVDWFFAYPMKVYDRGLLKKVKMRGSEEFLEMKDRFNLPFRYTDVRSKLSDEIEFYANNPDEILLAIKEYYKDYLMGFTSDRSLSCKSNSLMYMDFVSSVLQNSQPDKMSTYFTNSSQALSRFSLHVLASQGSVYDFN